MTTAIVGTAIETSTQRRATFVAALGNILEWYDFTVYAYLAAIVAKLFFPAVDETASLLSSFAVFGVGFLARPLGGFVLGPIGDAKGRKFVLLLTMMLMAMASLVIGLCPSHASIGIAAPIILVLARLVQGFSAGGEFGSAAVFLVEWASPGRRGLAGSSIQLGTFGGALLGSGIVALISSTITPEALEDWGWRVPFIFGGILGIVAMYARRHVHETPVFRKVQVMSSPAVSGNGVTKAVIQTIGIIVLCTVSAYATFVYMPTFTQKFGGLTRPEALWANTIGLVIAVVLIPVAGALSDRIGRRPTMGLSAAGFVLLSVPLFHLLSSGRTFTIVVEVQAIFAVLAALSCAPVPAAISESFATESRTTGVTIASAIAATIFGGFAPFMLTFLIDQTANPIAAAFYVVFAGIVTGVTLLTMRETAFERLRA